MVAPCFVTQCPVQLPCLWMHVCLGHARCRSLLHLFFLESLFSGWAQSHVPGFAGTSAHAVALFQLRARQQEAEWALCVSAVAFSLRLAGGHLDSLLGNPTRCQCLQVFSLEPIFFFFRAISTVLPPGIEGQHSSHSTPLGNFKIGIHWAETTQSRLDPQRPPLPPPPGRCHRFASCAR